jgi:hypothetical protein
MGRFPEYSTRLPARSRGKCRELSEIPLRWLGLGRGWLECDWEAQKRRNPLGVTRQGSGTFSCTEMFFHPETTSLRGTFLRHGQCVCNRFSRRLKPQGGHKLSIWPIKEHTHYAPKRMYMVVAREQLKPECDTEVNPLSKLLARIMD